MLARGLHLGGQLVAGSVQLIEGEAGDLGDHVIQRRLEAGGGIRQLDFVQPQAHGHLGADPGDGIARGLAGKRRRTADAGVDLDQVIPEGIGVQGELHVAASLHAQGADDLQRAVPQQLVFLVGQGLAGSHHDAVTGVDAHGVDVFHVADGDGGVVAVPHHLVFDFLVALDALFHQHLMHGAEL